MHQQWYHVVLWDDNDHSYDYVTEMLRDLFGFSIEEAYDVAEEIDSSGCAVCYLTKSKHVAEQWRRRIAQHGPDQRVDHSKTSMVATVEKTKTRDEHA